LPVAIGEPIPFAAIADIKDRQATADYLRARTYDLARDAREIRPESGLRRKFRALRRRVAA
jgi:hypothetical protein